MYAINGKGNVLGISFTIKQEIDEAYHPHTCVSCWLKERKHMEHILSKNYSVHKFIFRYKFSLQIQNIYMFMYLSKISYKFTDGY